MAKSLPSSLSAPPFLVSFLALFFCGGGCAAPASHRVTYHLVDGDAAFGPGVPAARLRLAVTVATGDVVATAAQDAPAGLRASLPSALRTRGVTLSIAMQPETRLDGEAAVLLPAAPSPPAPAEWALALRGQALRFVATSPWVLAGPGWVTELRFEVKDTERGPRIEVTEGADGAFEGRRHDLGHGGWLWIGPRSGWERAASGTLVAVGLRKG